MFKFSTLATIYTIGVLASFGLTFARYHINSIWLPYQRESIITDLQTDKKALIKAKQEKTIKLLVEDIEKHRQGIDSIDALMESNSNNVLPRLERGVWSWYTFGKDLYQIEPVKIVVDAAGNVASTIGETFSRLD